MQIAFIGGGNMATALIAGLLRKPKSGLTLRVADPNEDARGRLRKDFGIEACIEAVDAAADADVIVLAIKPQVMNLVLAQLKPVVHPTQLIVSIAAGTSIDAIAQQLNSKQAIVRAMPNTPALIGFGIAGLCAGQHCKPHHLEQAERVLAAGGETVWIDDESLMDAVTAVSGSGPAYFFLLTEAMTEAGIHLGLSPEIARRLATRTCVGAGAMLADSTDSAAELRRKVTSPGGTTQAATEAFESGGFRKLVESALTAAELRGKALSGGSS